MATAALIAYGLYLALAFGLRTVMQLRRTGSSGFKGVSGRVGSAEWLAGVLFVVALLVGVAAPVLALADVVEPVEALDTTAVHVAGVVLFVLGLAATLAAQVAMGESWRIGVDEAERTELVTDGPFSLARNPIFAAMLPTSLGLALMVPSWVAFAASSRCSSRSSCRCGSSRSPTCGARTAARTWSTPPAWGGSCPGVGRLRDRA